MRENKQMLFRWSFIFISSFTFVFTTQSSHAAPLKVVSVTTDLAWVAKQIGGTRVQVRHFLTGKEDPHHVSARPSLILLASNADLFISPGMSLDVGYTPLILRNSRNPQIIMGAKGFVDASIYVRKQQVLTNVTRAMGDQHAQGNPHYHLDPIAIIDAGRAVLAGYLRVDPGYTKQYIRNFKRFRKTMLIRLVGKTLVQAAGVKRLLGLLHQYKLIPFLQKTQVGGRPLLRYLGGWMKQMMPLRGQTLISYHRQWVYFLKRFGLRTLGQLEPKPGIPPSASHLKRILNICKQARPKRIVAANFFSAGSAQFVSKKSGIPLLLVPFHTQGVTSASTYPKLLDVVIQQFVRGK